MQAEHVDGHVDHDGHREHRYQELLGAEEPRQRQAYGADDQDRADEVQPDEDDFDRGPGVEYVGAEELEHALERHPGLVLQPRDGRLRLDRCLPVSAQGGDDPRCGRAEAAGRGGRRGQGQLVPARGAPRSRPDQAPAGAERRYAYQRRDAGDQHDRVGDHGPGQQDEDHERHEPPRCPPALGRDAVDHQPRDQHGNGGAGVVRGQEQDLGGAELGRQHDARGQQRPRPASAAGGPALGQPRSQQDEQGVGQGRADVDHPGAQSQHSLDQRVLRQLGGVERHVRDLPTVQQQVPVQHGLRLQHDARSVGPH